MTFTDLLRLFFHYFTQRLVVSGRYNGNGKDQHIFLSSNLLKSKQRVKKGVVKKENKKFYITEKGVSHCDLYP